MARGSDGAAAQILVVDDDEQIRTLLRRVLGAEGFSVQLASTGAGGLDAARTDSPDLVLLDVDLPDEDGRDVLAKLREIADVPVILLTGMGDEHDRILGLKLGADDYVVKPFSPGELAARIHTVLRRTARTPRPAAEERGLRFEHLTIDPATREVRVRGEVVEMTAKEFDLLAFLASSPRQVFSRGQLLEHVWGSSDAWQDDATVTEHVRRVRRRIEVDPLRPRWVVTVRGVGYRFEP